MTRRPLSRSAIVLAAFFALTLLVIVLVRARPLDAQSQGAAAVVGRQLGRLCADLLPADRRAVVARCDHACAGAAGVELLTAIALY